MKAKKWVTFITAGISAVIAIQKTLFITISRGLSPLTNKKRRLRKQRRLFLMLARSTPIALSPIFMMKLLCRPNSVRRTKQTTVLLCKPMDSMLRR